VNNVDDAIYSTKLLAQTTLRNALGMKTLTEMLTEREAIAQLTETILDEGTEHWGVKVERVEVKDIRLPQNLTRAMAAEAEAAREARAKVVAADGEKNASRALREAAEVIGQSSVALQLRHLQVSSVADKPKNGSSRCRRYRRSRPSTTARSCSPCLSTSWAPSCRGTPRRRSDPGRRTSHTPHRHLERSLRQRPNISTHLQNSFTDDPDTLYTGHHSKLDGNVAPDKDGIDAIT